MIRLWHFTGSAHLAGIRASGILPFAFQVPSEHPQHRVVWLTDDPRWEAQPWATAIDHDCDRTEYRVRVHVSEADPRLRRYLEVQDAFGPELLALPEWRERAPHWWIYRGVVDVGALRTVEKRPKIQLARGLVSRI